MLNYEEISIDELEDMDEDVWLEISADPNAPEEFLEWLTQEKAYDYVDIQDNLAHNPAMTSHLLGDLLRSLDDGYLVYEVIKHPNFDEDSIEAYIGDTEGIDDLKYVSDDLKIALIKSDKLNEFYLQILSQDDSHYVRRAIAASRYLDDNMAENLLNFIERGEDDYYGNVIEALVANPSFSSLEKDIINRVVVNIHDRPVAKVLARNKNLSPRTLHLLERKFIGDSEILEYIKENPNYRSDYDNPKETLEELNYSGDFHTKKTDNKVKHQNNSDLELLKRLKGYIS